MTFQKPRVLVRPLSASDEKEFLAAVRRSRALHRGWAEPAATPVKFRAYLRRLKSRDHRSFLIVHKASGEIAGVVNVSQIYYGPFQSAYLGYYAMSGFESRGLMREGLRLVIREAFGKLKLHRLEANIQPENRRSIELVKSLGFRMEGYSPRYLKVAGKWRDHERWAILKEDFTRVQGSKADRSLHSR